MIVPMSKVFIATQSHNHAKLLDILAKLGVVHIEPVDPNKAVAEEKILNTLSKLDHALQILQKIETAGDTPDISPMEACAEAIEINKTIVEQKERLSTLHRTASQLTIWGNVEVKRLKHLSAMGIQIRFFSVAKKDMTGLKAECIEVISEISGKDVMIAVIDRIGTFKIPEGAKEIQWPSTDLPTLKKEAAELDASLKKHDKRLAQLANLINKIKNEQKQYQSKADFRIAQNSGLTSKALFAIQGWVPTAKAESLTKDLEKHQITAAVDIKLPEEDEKPPTLIEYPKWVKPIKALFDMLGTLPGYKEYDLSPFFMIALPLFAAMLIGDAGYGLIFAGAGIIFYKKIVKAASKPAADLLIIFGVITLIWGILTANYFGITPQSLIDTGRDSAAKFMISLAPLWRQDGVESRNLIMQVSLIIGCLHLVIAHLFKGIQLLPDIRAYAEFAWSVILIDMLVLIYFLMFVGAEKIPAVIGIILLFAFAAVSWFTAPMKSPVKRVLIGFASSILPLLSTFSDIMSYIRLFAVGLASYYIAAAFNGLGADVAKSATWVAGAPIVIFGHVLNIGLAAIAIFAHGVRLNMLEFSNNVGVQWAGYAYQPFIKEEKISIGDNEL
ncbi:MAG: hypothetical protein JXA96_15850 [Sedimentisphaerales bacterium]|nr:hypothetical protein [Sedimentisphaerales bacterium]